MKCTYLDMGSASGALGGKVFSRNQYGNYIRTRAIPTNPNTDRQQGARSRFQQCAERWSSTLTAAQRTAWNLYGSSVDMLDALGQTINLSGFSHYIRSNSQQLQCNSSVVDAGPTTFTLPEADSNITAAISEATQLITVTFDTNLAWVTENLAFLAVYMTSPQSAGRTYLDIKPRYADCVQGSPGSPPASPQTIAVPYVVVEGDQVIVKFRIGRGDGRLSYFFQRSVTVAA